MAASTAAFSYWERNSREASKSAKKGEIITLNEQVEYVLSFSEKLSQQALSRLDTLGGEAIDDKLAVICFRNFVGRTDLADVPIEVVSSKIGTGGVSKLLQEISQLSSSLIFGWHAPTSFLAIGGNQHIAPVPYHQLQYLRHVMLGAPVGHRVQDWFAAVERNPTRRFAPERPVVSPDRVKRLDHRAVSAIFSRMDRLVPVPATSGLIDNPIAKKLTFGVPAREHFPERVAAPRGRLSFDTIENRFIKHSVAEFLSLVHRFAEHPRLHEQLRNDCGRMQAILEEMAASQFLTEVLSLSGFQAPSQALAKSDGYREMFAFWGEFTRHVALPRSASDATRLLEGKDVATLYEYWVFVKIVEVLVQISGAKPVNPKISRSDLGDVLEIGFSTAMGAQITVRYNPTFSRSRATAYSTPLRPDVTVQIGQRIHAFDAKYRLDWVNTDETDFDIDPATYKRADLYKMHTYRDAIRELSSAFIVYPGSEFVFFERSGNKRTAADALVCADGVGAAPLRPMAADPAMYLRTLLSRLLSLSVVRQSA